MSDKVEISKELLNNILAYISSKPFNEVAGLIQSVHQQIQPQLSQVAPVEDE